MKEHEVDMFEFIDVKGWKSLGNKLTEFKPMSIKALHQEVKEAEPDPESEIEIETISTDAPSTKEPTSKEPAIEDESLSVGSEIEFDIKPEQKEDKPEQKDIKPEQKDDKPTEKKEGDDDSKSDDGQTSLF